MSEFKSSNFRNEDGSGGPDIVGVTTFTSPYYFVPPSGTTAERPSDPAPGMLRFNEDIGRLEVWRNDHWATILGESPNLGGGTGSNTGVGARGLLMGGNPAQNVIQYITIPTFGDSQDFGDLTNAPLTGGALADRTRGIYAGGEAPARTNVIQFVTIASTGNASDFGDLSSGARAQGIGSVSDRTRGVLGGGYIAPAKTNAIDYITIQSTGNSVDYGDLSIARDSPYQAMSSVRGIFAGGNIPTSQNIMEYITISTTGNAQDFGDLPTAISNGASGGNATRGLFAGGAAFGGSVSNAINFITISTLGDATDFGDLTLTAFGAHGGCSSPTRCVWGGFATPGAVAQDTMNSVEIQTTGNALDFGDMLSARNYVFGISNAHGGL